MYKKVLSGVISKVNLDKTVTVIVKKDLLLDKYSKTVTKNFKYLAHDENNFFSPNEKVFIASYRPISGLKKWNVLI